MEITDVGSIVGGVVGSNILIRIIWSYLENRKKGNPNGEPFGVINERLQRIIDKLDSIHDDIKNSRGNRAF